MLNVAMMNVTMLGKGTVTLYIVMLSVVMLTATMLIVVAPSQTSYLLKQAAKIKKSLLSSLRKESPRVPVGSSRCTDIQNSNFSKIISS